MVPKKSPDCCGCYVFPYGPCGRCYEYLKQQQRDQGREFTDQELRQAYDEHRPQGLAK